MSQLPPPPGPMAPADPVASTRPAAMQANVQQNLRALQREHGARMKSLNDQVADHLVKQIRPDPQTDRAGYMEELSQRIKDMEDKAKAVKKSKSGNMQAHDTYTQIAGVLKQRLISMQNEDIGHDQGQQQAQPAAQPGMGAQPSPDMSGGPQ